MRTYFILFILAILLAPPCALAQKATNSVEGVAGDIDKHRRGPIVTVSTEVTDGSAKILADVDMPRDEFDKFPVKFEFFINRKLFSTQIRSPELPGAVGVDIGSDIASLPFNFAVVATTLHPNKNYTSVYQGGVFASNLLAVFDCTLTSDLGKGQGSEDFSATGIQTGQTGNENLTLNFTGESTSSGNSVNASLSLTISDTSASGTLVYGEEGSATTAPVSGTVEKTDGNLTLVSVSSEEQTVELECAAG